mmetsp:Transcript_13441/g.16604  ORF Transcript_13441/g.16604 Transcript_13441/m.16604 type:complete len:273 (-) Transcript_13441:802-1620(-)
MIKSTCLVDLFNNFNMFLPRTYIPERLTTAFSKPLLVDGCTSEDCRFDVGDQWHSSFNCPSAHLETVGHSIGIHGIRHVDHHVHLASLQEGQHIWFPLDQRLVDQAARHTMFFQEVMSTLGSEQAEAHVLQLLSCPCAHKLLLGCVGTKGDDDVLLWKLEVGSKHALQEGLVDIHPKACHFTSGRHFYPKARIGILQPSEGEHGALAGDVVDIHRLDDGWMDGEASHDPCCQFNEVHIVGLGNEGHGSGSPQIALNDLHLIVLANELDVEWS